jgi:hypothetical protein
VTNARRGSATATSRTCVVPTFSEPRWLGQGAILTPPQPWYVACEKQPPVFPKKPRGARMLLRATLGGIAGVVDLGFQLRSGTDGEWEGTFFFQPGDEPMISRMMEHRPAVLETTLEEERRTLPVTITSAGSGLAFFRGEAWSRPTDRPTRLWSPN